MNTMSTSALVAVFETNMPAAMDVTETADLRPLRTGRKSDMFSRTRGTKAEAEQAAALIAAMRTSEPAK